MKMSWEATLVYLFTSFWCHFMRDNKNVDVDSRHESTEPYPPTENIPQLSTALQCEEVLQ